MGKHSAPDSPVGPVLRIVKGNPSIEELAALTALLAASPSGCAPEAPPARVGGWADPARLMRQPLRGGHGAWEASTW